jgi:hypothetical protein
MLDGNAIAGLLQEVFAVEMTTAIGTRAGRIVLRDREQDRLMPIGRAIDGMLALAPARPATGDGSCSANWRHGDPPHLGSPLS